MHICPSKGDVGDCCGGVTRMASELSFQSLFFLGGSQLLKSSLSSALLSYHPTKILTWSSSVSFCSRLIFHCGPHSSCLVRLSFHAKLVLHRGFWPKYLASFSAANIPSQFCMEIALHK